VPRDASPSKTCKALRLSNKNILKGGHKGVAMGDQLETPPSVSGHWGSDLPSALSPYGSAHRGGGVYVTRKG
jgi:hypothetical protein